MWEIKREISPLIQKFIDSLKSKTTIRNLKISPLDIEDISNDFGVLQQKVPNFVETEKYYKDNFSDVLIIGDIHGDMDSLMRIIQPFFDKKVKSLIFLGDYVDRGKDSLRCLLSVVAMTLTWPDRIITLRGNHEEVETNYRYGFSGMLQDEFKDPDDLKNVIMDIDYIYNMFSMATKTPQYSVCVHGGIPNNMELFRELNEIPKPHTDILKMMGKNSTRTIELYHMFDQLRWNDPSENIKKDFEASFRGPDYYKFGRKPLEKLLSRNNSKRLIRAHESSRGGYDNLFDGKLIHVFSAEPYFGHVKKAYTIHEIITNEESKTFLRDLDFNIISEIKPPK